MTTLKNLIGKTCDISLLKGITHESFSKQNKISKIVAKNFLKAKKKDSRSIFVEGSMLLPLIWMTIIE